MYTWLIYMTSVQTQLAKYITNFTCCWARNIAQNRDMNGFIHNASATKNRHSKQFAGMKKTKTYFITTVRCCTVPVLSPQAVGHPGWERHQCADKFFPKTCMSWYQCMRVVTLCWTRNLTLVPHYLQQSALVNECFQESNGLVQLEALSGNKK